MLKTVVDIIDVHLDFETFSKADLKKVGAWVYSGHPSTEVLCTAYAYEDEGPHMCKGALSPIPDFLLKENWGRFRVHAHNSFFEYCIILNTMGIEPPPLEYWVDTAAAAAAMSLPRALGDLSRVLGLPADKAKDKRGKFLISKLCSPQVSKKKATKGQITVDRDPDLLAEMYEYCRQDVIAEREVSKRIFALSPAEQRVWVVDQKINVRGVRVDKEMVNHCIAIYEKQRDAVITQLKEMTELDNPNSQPQFLEWAREQGYTEDNLQADTLRDFLEQMGDDNPEFKKAIQLKVSLGRTAPKKFYALLRRLGKDGRIHGNFMYHGASTGRWASLGINLQNLLRPKMKDVDFIFQFLPKRDHKLLEFMWGDTIEALASCIRGMLIPSPGGRFIICDYSQIEARVIAWLAGEESTLEVFRQDRDIYIHAASQIFQIAPEEVTEKERFSGKTAILACGFQGGWAALQKMAKNYGVELEDDFCNMIVKKWRKQNPRIVQYWKATENAAVAAIKNPGKEFLVQNFMEDSSVDIPPIKYKVSNGFLFCKLPSGRLLSYAQPSVETKKIILFTIGGEFPRSVVFNPKVQTISEFHALAERHGAEVKDFKSYSIRFWGVDSKKRWSRQHAYGGLFCENNTQGVARDRLAVSLVDLDEAGYDTAIHVHDEPVSDVPYGQGSLKEVKSIMLSYLNWAEGLPLDADGSESERFKK